MYSIYRRQYPRVSSGQSSVRGVGVGRGLTDSKRASFTVRHVRAA